MSDSPQSPGMQDAALLNYWLILKRHLALVFAIPIASIIVVGVITKLMTPYYSATATIEIDPKAPSLLDVDEVFELVSTRNSDERRSYYTTQYRIIKSRRVLGESIRRLRENHNVTDFDASDDPVEDLLDMLELTPEGDTQLVHITIEHPDPAMAVLFSRTLAQTYMDVNVERAQERSQDALVELEENQRNFEVEITQAPVNQEELDLVRTAERSKTAQITLAKIQEDLANVRTRIPEFETEYLELRARIPSEKQVIDGTDGDRWLGLVSFLAIENPGLSLTYDKLQELRQEEVASKGRYKEEHPKTKRLDEKTIGTRLLMRQQLQEYMDGREAKLDLLRERELSLAKQAESLIGEMEELKESQTRYDRKQASFVRQEQLYQEMGKRLAEVRINTALEKNNISWIDEPISSKDPVRPKLFANLVLAAGTGTLVGVALAFLLEYLRPDVRVKTTEDIEDYVGIPVLGPVPVIPPREFEGMTHQILVYAKPRSQLAEHLRTIRTTILFRTQDKRLRRLLVTSAMEQEGKSFISSNLAAIMCMAGGRVLLIDADLRRPRQHTIFGVTNEYGLSNVLQGEMTLDQAILKSPVPNLDVVTAGPPPQNPAELLESEAMVRLLDSITGYDLVLIDSPPVQPVADPLILSRLVDGVIMVVRFHRAPKKQVLRCRQRLTEVDAPLLGAIGNRYNEQPDDYYGSGYGYGYGTYGYGTYGYTSPYHEDGNETGGATKKKTG